MEALKADKSWLEFFTVYGFFRVWVVEKTSSGNCYKCKLYQCNGYGVKVKNGVEFEWVIPTEYLNDNGHYVHSNDVYFARWSVSSYPEVFKNKYGHTFVKDKYYLKKLISFWNIRVFPDLEDLV